MCVPFLLLIAYSNDTCFSSGNDASLHYISIKQLIACLVTSCLGTCWWLTPLTLLGIILTLLIIELIGRKITMAVEFFGCVAGFLLLLWCVPP